MSARSRAFCLLSLVAASVPAVAANHTVVVGGGGLIYTPSVLTIAQGDTVTFTNAPGAGGGGFHNVASDAGAVTTFRCSNDCSGNSDPSSNAWVAVVTFPSVGTVNYHCDAHQFSGMTGTINVTIPVTLQSFDVD
jgi:plastocyanin